jgi:hypothetical protein
VANNTHQRAVEIFGAAASSISADCKAMLNEHAAKGILGTGATVNKAVDAFDARSKDALQQALNEVANRVDHRGRQWTREMREVERALGEHINSAPDLVADALHAAGFPASTQNVVSGLIDASAQDLRMQFAAFRDGWTSPRSRPWNERHPMLYALALLVAGAVVGQLATHAGDRLAQARPNGSALASTKSAPPGR